MMMAVYGGVAMAGQAVKSPSNMTAMIIRVILVILVPRPHFNMPDNGRNDVNSTRFLTRPLDVQTCL
jgi:hypothetical protein